MTKKTSYEKKINKFNDKIFVWNVKLKAEKYKKCEMSCHLPQMIPQKVLDKWNLFSPQLTIKAQ